MAGTVACAVAGGKQLPVPGGTGNWAVFSPPRRAGVQDGGSRFTPGDLRAVSLFFPFVARMRLLSGRP